MLHKGGIELDMFTTRAIENDRLEFNIDNGLDQDLLRYCDGICQESCGADFDPACGDCHVTRLYYAMLRLAEYEDTGLTPEEVAGLKSQLAEVQHRGKAAAEERVEIEIREFKEAGLIEMELSLLSRGRKIF
jgi:hypothetical protein